MSESRIQTRQTLTPKIVVLAGKQLDPNEKMLFWQVIILLNLESKPKP